MNRFTIASIFFIIAMVLLSQCTSPPVFIVRQGSWTHGNITKIDYDSISRTVNVHYSNFENSHQQMEIGYTCSDYNGTDVLEGGSAVIHSEMGTWNISFTPFARQNLNVIYECRFRLDTNPPPLNQVGEKFLRF